MKMCSYMIHKYFLQVTTLYVVQNYAILVVLAQLLTTLVWIECDGSHGSYFLEWWGYIFGFCAKSHIIISFLFEPVSLLSWFVALLFSFSFEWLLMGCFLRLEFSVLTCLFIGNQKRLVFFSIHALRSAYYIISSLYNFSFFLCLLILIGC